MYHIASMTSDTKQNSQQEGAPPRNRPSRSQKQRQQRWSNFTKMKASSLMQVRQSQREVSTIDEENGDTFDEEYNFSAGYGPNASFSLGNDEDGTSATRTPTSSNGFNVNVNVEDDDDDDDNTAIGDGMDDSAYEAAPPSLSTPPVHRSVDVLPTMFSLHQPSNVLTDEVSVYSEVTEHSMATQQINNRHANHSDDVTVMTTSTMVTRQVGNTVAQRENNHAQMLLSTPPSSFASSPNGGVGGSSADIESNRHHHHHHPSTSLSSTPSINTTAPRRIGSGSRRPSTMGRTLMNNQGHTMSDEEMRLVWEAAGKCIECGVVTTHKKEKYGPFGTFRRMAPQTVEGFSYKGYCLRCHDVPQLRRLLNEPDIPLDLMRDDPRSASIRSLQSDNPHNPQHHHDAVVAEFLNRKSPIGVLCTSIKFQLCCGMVLLAIAGAIVAIGISMAKGPEPWVSPAPTMAPTLAPTTTYPTTSPTSWEWTLSSEIRTEIESFGYRIDLSSNGDVLAVSSPNYDGGKGRFDIYLLEEVGDEQKWVTPNFVTGTAQTGTNARQFMSQGMSLSGDGSTVALGSPGNGTLYGLVQVYRIDLESLRISTKGQMLVGPSTGSEFGYAVSLNFDGSRLFVGAPNYGVSSTELNGLVRCYVYNANTDQWEQDGDDMLGLMSGSRFGHSISCDDSGYRVVVGSPLDSTKWENAGQVLVFQLDADMTWQFLPADQVTGAYVGSKLGSSVAANEDGLIFITNDRDENVEKFSNAGIATVYGVVKDTGQINLIGFPIAGTHYNAGLGHDLDLSDSGEYIIASGTNLGKKAGSIQVHLFNMGNFEMYGKELTELEVGTCDWFGSGPSVTIAARQLRMAVGYECIMSNGISRSTVRVFDLFAVEA